MSLATESATADHLLESYAPESEAYDEYFAGTGDARPQALRFLHELRDVELSDFERRREQAWRTIAENSVHFSSGADERTNRPWQFDSLPLILEAADWARVSTGLSQRARLLDEILADLYGPQRLLQSGLIPPELIFRHPGYLRVFHGLRAPEETRLHLYAADIARSPDGQWWVTADRTESPSGIGYALENRLVSASMYQDSFRADQVERHAPFFLALRERLQRLTPRHRDNPRIVLLSQGPANANYYEDAYLSRYLGYTVVEGGDLAVREGQVLLKTLGGLLPVDIILRRVDDGDCDPLELRGDSMQGVAGLVQSVRSGQVVMANSLGSGLLECPALPAYLHQLCRELFGEELLMKSVATWWCGNETHRAHVLGKLDQLIVRHTYRDGRQMPWIGPLLSRREKEHLADAIKSRPAEFVGQELVNRSTAPVWLGDRVESWRVGLRTYLVSVGRNYECLPGGLARVSPSSHTLDVSISRGEGSKDAWVLASGPVAPVSLLKPAGYIQGLKRSGSELPSRVADNLFWLGRNAERAEGAARLLRTFLVRLLGESGGIAAPEVQALVWTLADTGLVEPGYAVESVRLQLPPLEIGLPRTVFDANDPSSLRSILSRLNRSASLVRERLSLDSWRLINRLHHEFHADDHSGDGDLSRLQEQLNRLVIDLSALSGLVAESMTRTLGWRFLDLGRRLERALHTIALTRSLLSPVREREAAVLETALEVADSLLTYRSRYLTNLQLAPVVDLLLTDETNPRSLAFQLVRLCDHIEHLPRDSTQPLRSAEQRMSMSTLHWLRMISADELIGIHARAQRELLDRQLNRLSLQLPKLSDLVSHRYLIHAGLPRQLTELRHG